MSTPTIVWIFSQWLRNTHGHIAASIFVIGLLLLVVNRKSLQIKRRQKSQKALLIFGIVLLLAGSFISPISYNILKALFFFEGALLVIFSWFKIKNLPLEKATLWGFCSLPVIPRIGTSLYNGSYGFHVDAGCSGVQGLYLLTGMWVLLVFYNGSKKPTWKTLGKILGLFWLLNGLRVGGLYFLHNYQHMSPLGFLDSTWGIINFTICLGILILWSR